MASESHVKRENEGKREYVSSNGQQDFSLSLHQRNEVPEELEEGEIPDIPQKKVKKCNDERQYKIDEHKGSPRHACSRNETSQKAVAGTKRKYQENTERTSKRNKTQHTGKSTKRGSNNFHQQRKEKSRGKESLKGHGCSQGRGKNETTVTRRTPWNALPSKRPRTFEKSSREPPQKLAKTTLSSEKDEKRENPIGYKKLENICLLEDKEKSMSEIITIEKRFLALVNTDEEIRVDLFKLVINCYAIICQSKNRTTQAICFLQKSCKKFLCNHVPYFISKFLPKFEDTSEIENFVGKLLLIFDQMLSRVGESVKYHIPLPQLKEEVKSLHETAGKLSDEVNNGLEMKMKTTDQLLQVVRRHNPSTNSCATPPEDYRQLSIVPVDDDFRPGYKPFLRKMILDAPYDDAMQYLDIQFRLLREDFVKTLRDGIKYRRDARSLKGHPQKYSKQNKQNFLVYDDVKILSPVCNRKGGVYRVRLNLKQGNLRRVNWRKSKLLKFGALVCLSNDFFENLYFGAVENRDPSHLQQGELEIRFENCDFETMQGFIIEKCSFQMIESEAYFESYRHNLSALQQIDPESLPFKEHIVRGDVEVLPPTYLLEVANDNSAETEDEDFVTVDFQPNGPNSSSTEADKEREREMDLTSMVENNSTREIIRIKVTQLDQWPSKEKLGLDESQYHACQMALSKRFALIQGPPGTGKTHVGLKIANVLIKNHKVWRGEEESPMLMVAYTNHALDQFLMGLDRKKGVVRVGGRSKVEELQQYNLKTLRKNRGGVNRLEKHLLFERIKEIENQWRPREASKLIALSSSMSVLSVSFLRYFMDARLYQDMKEESEAYNSDLDEVLLRWLGVDRERSECNRKEVKEKEFPEAQRLYEEDEDNEEDNVPVVVACYQNEAKNFQKFEKQLQINTTMTDDEERRIAARGRGMFRLSQEERWKLYRLWREKLERNFQDRIYQSQLAGYETEQKKLNDIEEAENYKILRQAKVIAMTTTCAARHHGILQRIRPKIVLVEEAAEVLEAHILTSLSSGCEHLILIGDHQQLRPNCTVYKLAKEYNLNISMFERLVKLGVPCVRLSEQHRMRPEIALLMKHIYSHLTDHPSVMEYEDVRGIKKNLFFLDHEHPEDSSEDNHSHVNEHEAMYLAKLCWYLIQQEYKPSEITILTPYLGQMFKIKDCLEEDELPKEIRISTVDNFQGEENHIILLSLVRSNDENQVGFVGDINRACVALSRARNGLYVIGNSKVLTTASGIWKNVVSSLKESGQFGKALPLCCLNHKTEIPIKEPSEFLAKAPRGGCDLPCQYRLECGHVCTLSCHPSDPEHKRFRCLEACTKTIPGCNHICQNICWQLCQTRCEVKVEKTLPCGHTREDVRCGDEPSNVKCKERCEKELPCRHQCQAKCGEICTSSCQELVKRTDWPCGHHGTIACSATPLNCRAPCPDLDCGHECSGSCGECLQGRVHKRCRNKCSRTLVCSHVCGANCVACPPCSNLCQNSCKHSKCKKKCGDPCVPCQHDCEWKCKHKKCGRKCGQVCDRSRCDVPCNELVKKCQHKCRGLCGESCICVKERCAHRKDIQKIFGTEEFQDANVRFIRLEDCGHIFEVSGLDQWMDMRSSGDDEDSEAIQMKACPCCKTPIRKTVRYTNIINERLADIERVKLAILGDQTEFSSNKVQTQENLDKYYHMVLKNQNLLKDRESDRHKNDCEILKKRVSKCEYSRHLSFLTNQVSHLSRCLSLKLKINNASWKGNSVKEKVKIMEILNYLTNKRIIGCNVEREINDINLEITRQRVLFEALNLINELEEKDIPIDPTHKGTLDEITNQFSASTKIEESELESILQEIKNIRTNYPVIALTEEEKQQIVKAMSLKTGSWYKCPKGHIYAIGECGGAMQRATCPEPDCRSAIGGENHRLEEGNSVATEMDGARHAAWSEQANMENYQLD